MEAVQKVLKLARQQWGLITFKQVCEFGLTDRFVKNRVKSGQWRRVHRGVYQTGPGALLQHQKELAALLAAGPKAALSHGSAARWLRISTAVPERIQITVPMNHSRCEIEGVDLHFSRDLEDDVLERKPLRLTSRGRTLLDMSATQEPAERRATFESCLREDRNNIKGIIKTLEAQAPGRAGAVALWALVEEYLGPQKVPDSVLESYAMELGLATGRKPVVRPVIWDGPKRIAEVDLAWPELFVCMQSDGYWPHTSSAQFERDHAQNRDLDEVGWTVKRYTYKEVTEQKDMVLASLLKAHKKATEKQRGAAEVARATSST